MKIEGRTFVISGGASGLGRACVVDICKKGGYACVLDMNEEMGEEFVKELGGKAKFWKCNVLETESVAAAVKGSLAWIKETGAELGGIIPAAGVAIPAKMLDREGKPLDLDNFNFVLAVNITGTIDLIRQLLPHLSNVAPGPDNERGIIIMVSSSAAFDGQPGQVAYSASKGAVRAMTLPMTRDLARYGIRVVTVAPALFESGMTKVMGEKVKKSLERVMEFPVRAGKPHEFSGLVVHAIENIMLNGVVLRLDGGMRMPSKM